METEQLQKLLSINKALTFDGYCDVQLKKTKKYNIISNFWNNDTMQKLGSKIFQARLILLNKSYPNIPKADAFRLIVFLSPMLKWLNLRFLNQLKDHCLNQIDKNQIGFFDSTQLNILQLAEKIKSTKPQTNSCLIFIDLSSAYNSVDRNLLFQIIKDRQIFNSQELDFLYLLQNNIYFQNSNGKKVIIKNGTHQGDPLAPFLFNIYMDQFIKVLQSKFCLQWHKIYADDIVFLVQEYQINYFLQVLTEICKIFKLIINKTKSGIFKIRKRLPKNIKQLYDGIPVVSKYKYLGVTFDHTGSIKLHLNQLKKRLNYILKQTIQIRFNMQVENQFLIWLVFVRPHFLYIFSFLQTQSNSVQQKTQKLFRQTFKKALFLPLSTSDQIVEIYIYIYIFIVPQGTALLGLHTIIYCNIFGIFFTLLIYSAGISEKYLTHIQFLQEQLIYTQLSSQQIALAISVFPFLNKFQHHLTLLSLFSYDIKNVCGCIEFNQDNQDNVCSVKPNGLISLFCCKDFLVAISYSVT
ncbi:hypothetical protein ABPG72_001416 [Tetrahymena utriculariae]